MIYEVIHAVDSMAPLAFQGREFVVARHVTLCGVRAICCVTFHATRECAERSCTALNAPSGCSVVDTSVGEIRDMAYTLHRELPDGTLETAFGKAHAAKATAVRIARDCAKSAHSEATARIIVQDANEMTVAAFEVRG